jgi:kynureninase
MLPPFTDSLPGARELDQADSLAKFREAFLHPLHGDSRAIYFCGHSLGLQPKNVQASFAQELKDWEELAVGGYRNAKQPWLFYQQAFAPPLSRLLGCAEQELTVMNSLTVNLHLLLTSFFQPSPDRYQILMEAGAFPSDQYAVQTQIAFHCRNLSRWGIQPAPLQDWRIELSPRDGEKILREEDILESIDKHKESLALVLLGGINYYSGQLLDMKTITAAAHRAGALAGFDLAHAVGNVPLRLSEWDLDFAVWCSYKYLNGGPGAAGGAYIHERHAKDRSLVRLGGWWGSAEDTRFQMLPVFVPKADAHGWNLSTAPVFNLAALRASLELFAEAGMDQLRSKSLRLTAYLEYLLKRCSRLRFTVITPEDPDRRGAQLSLYFSDRGKEVFDHLGRQGVIADYREPGVIRLAPAPMYNSFEDVYRLYSILQQL